MSAPGRKQGRSPEAAPGAGRGDAGRGDAGQGARRIETAIRAATASGRPAVAAFVTAGFPDRERFPGILDAVRRQADLVEVGVPFSDPMADGVTIQRASHTALLAGVTLAAILETLAARRDDGAPLLLMSYLNPLLAFGIDRLPAAARAAGVDGFIVPDLPHEEAGLLRPGCEAEGLALVSMVTPATPPDRLARLLAASRGFVYAVTRTGTTGGAVALEAPTRRYLERVRAASPVPVLAGFGIRDARALRALARSADGVVVGSALIESIERGDDPAAFLAALRAGAARHPGARAEARP